MNIVVGKGIIEGTLTPPSSKSYAQRALAVSLLAEGTSTLSSIEFCDDTLSAMKCIEALGAEVERVNESTLQIKGGLNEKNNSLFIGESGLATRLFTPIASLCSTPITINGHGSILQRPMTMMFEPLRNLGVEVQSNGEYLPITVKGSMRGGEIHVDGSLSSQFITGLLLALPKAENDTILHVHNAVSLPYIDMTIETARAFGVEITHHNYSEFHIRGNQKYKATNFRVEGDWSGASTILVAGAIAGGNGIKIDNLSIESKQADRVICDAMHLAGAHLIYGDNHIEVKPSKDLQAFTFDATQCPDLFPALVSLAAACKGLTTLKGTSRLVHKESNRALTLKEEYAKLGIEIDISQADLMTIKGGEITAANVNSHNDHRIAMSLAVSALRSQGEFSISDAECVAKSYPSFFKDLSKLRKAHIKTE